MPVPLPYPKRPEVPNLPTSLTRGLPKFRRLFDLPGPINEPPNYAIKVPQQKRVPDVGPMSSRGSYIRFLKEENVRSPKGLPAELLQILQGGGKPLAKPRADVLRLLIQSWLGGRDGR